MNIHVDLRTKTGMADGNEPMTLQKMAAKLERRVDEYIEDFVKLNTENRRILESTTQGVEARLDDHLK